MVKKDNPERKSEFEVPLSVSRAMVVVITLVKPAILPPTMKYRSYFCHHPSKGCNYC